MTVAAPVSADSAMLRTGLYLSEQKYSVILPMARPATRPQSTEPNRNSGWASVPELPPQEEDAEDDDDLDAGGQVGAAVERLVQLGALLGAHGEQADDGGDDATCGNHDGHDERPHQIDGVGEVAQRAERGGQDGGGPGWSPCRTRTGRRPYRPRRPRCRPRCRRWWRGCAGRPRGCRPPPCPRVGAHVGRLGVDAAAHAGEQRHGRGAGGEALHHADVLVHEVGHLGVDVNADGRAEHERDQPQRKAQKREGGHAQAHGEARLEADVERLGHRFLGGMRRAGVRARGDMHAHVARGRGKYAARHETPAPLWARAQCP